MSQELQYDRQVTTQSEAIKTSDVRDNSITDITVIDFDTSLTSNTAISCRDARPCVSLNMSHIDPLSQRHLDERSGPDPLELLESNQKIKRLTLIHRQTDIQSTTQDTTITCEQSEQHTKIQQQNKSSPDKASQAIFSTTTIIIILLILLAILIIIKFSLRR